MNRLLAIFLSLSTAISPIALAQEYQGMKLEQRIKDFNEVIRRRNFSNYDVPIIHLQVVDKDSKWPLEDARVELKHEDKRITDGYPVPGDYMYYNPYRSKTDEEGNVIFSVTPCHEEEITRLEVKCQGYYPIDVDFPLLNLLAHINNTLSNPLPDSIEQKLEFEYDWNNATVFRVFYENANEFIEKVLGDDIARYDREANNIFGNNFYSWYVNSLLGKKLPTPLMPPIKEFHILIPGIVEMEKVPEKIKIEY
ncbi:MAG: hypothetical protein IB618_03480 [Candidatus Pacearchaeota archaeon]|nr:MAG: hypothetical protein IB618_03480 [Candidatus Pacearchaeota archaeon]